MGLDSKEIQRKIKKAWSLKFQVCCEEIDGQNRLPSWEDDIYRPDILVKSKHNGEILYIIELQNSGRKAVVGASILADYCLKIMRQKIKPNLTFLVNSERGIKQLQNFRARCEIAKQYVTELSEISPIPINKLNNFLTSFGKKS